MSEDDQAGAKAASLMTTDSLLFKLTDADLDELKRAPNEIEMFKLLREKLIEMQKKLVAQLEELVIKTDEQPSQQDMEKEFKQYLESAYPELPSLDEPMIQGVKEQWQNFWKAKAASPMNKSSVMRTSSYSTRAGRPEQKLATEEFDIQEHEKWLQELDELLVEDHMDREMNK